LVSFVFCKAPFAPLKDMTVRAAERLQQFFKRPLQAAGAWHKRFYTRSCNQSAAKPVMVNGVDALLITWMILTQARWLKLRFKMTKRQLARWCDSFIRWLPKSSARIGHVEPRRKISAK
jgi:hypothetical protein